MRAFEGRLTRRSKKGEKGHGQAVLKFAYAGKFGGTTMGADPIMSGASRSNAKWIKGSSRDEIDEMVCG